VSWAPTPDNAANAAWLLTQLHPAWADPEPATQWWENAHKAVTVAAASGDTTAVLPVIAAGIRSTDASWPRRRRPADVARVAEMTTRALAEADDAVQAKCGTAVARVPA